MNDDTLAYITVGVIAALLLALAGLSVYIFVLQKPEPEKVHTPRPQFGTYPPDCGHLYNVDKHREWSECMGVATVPRVYLKRDDI